ncbi:MAG: LacI family transcriptional regulator [Clostridiaceae bacterium]|nr:LacI family transcriptional regulator [Clostridiaceae bacterium]
MSGLTIRDIANIAGVSQTTVSRVINNSPLVSANTRQKVLDVIKEHNFFPKHAAQTLANKKKVRTIAVLVSEINNEYFGNLLLGVNKIADKENFQIMIFHTNNNFNKIKTILEELRSYFISGIILTPTIQYCTEAQEKILTDRLNVLEVPIVLVDRTFSKYEYEGVFFNDKAAMYDATTNFIDAGDYKVGVVSGSFSGSLIEERDAGVFSAFADSGMEISEKDFIRCNYTVDEACSLTIKRFSEPDPPNAFLLGNNQIALGFLKALDTLNLKLNKDVFCVGIDEIPVLDYINYGYNFIKRDSKKMGEQAMKLLIDKINNPFKQFDSVYLSAPLVYRTEFSQKNSQRFGIA